MLGWPDGIEPENVHETFGFCPDVPHLPTGGTKVGEGTRIPHRGTSANDCPRLGDLDVFLCPATFTSAFPHDRRTFDARTIATQEGERADTVVPPEQSARVAEAALGDVDTAIVCRWEFISSVPVTRTTP